MTKVLNKIKENLFAAIIVIIYAIIFLLKPQMGIQAVKTSGYYIKEMLLIMPVIFILTALLDAWIPKQTIMKYLGKDAKSKGTILSFVLGSISAGPIYAAFPVCVMLHKKGASVKNIVIILSSWAVIKIPMLINEMKFLGFQFMAVRWVLTIIAIVIFSWLTSKIVKDNDIPQEEQKSPGIFINHEACMGCRLCTKTYPEIFEMQGKKAHVKEYEFVLDIFKLQKSMEDCPVKAIEYVE